MKLPTIALALMLTACASTQEELSESSVLPASEGFLSNYSLLQRVDLGDSSTTKRYVSPRINSAEYSSIYLEPVVFFPEPEGSDVLSENTLAEVSAHARAVIETSVKQSSLNLVEQPGPGVLRLKVAITGINTESDGMAVYHYIPIAFLISAATGMLNDVVVKIQIEGELSDSISGEPMILATKSGRGETLTNRSVPLALDNVKPLLDSWGETLTRTLDTSLQQQP